MGTQQLLRQRATTIASTQQFRREGESQYDPFGDAPTDDVAEPAVALPDCANASICTGAASH